MIFKTHHEKATGGRIAKKEMVGRKLFIAATEAKIHFPDFAFPFAFLRKSDKLVLGIVLAYVRADVTTKIGLADQSRAAKHDPLANFFYSANYDSLRGLFGRSLLILGLKEDPAGKGSSFEQ